MYFLMVDTVDWLENGRYSWHKRTAHCMLTTVITVISKTKSVLLPLHPLHKKNALK